MSANTPLNRLLKSPPDDNSLYKAMANVSAILTSTLDLNEVLARILEQMETVFNYDAANVMLIYKDGTTRVYRGHGYEQFGTQGKLDDISFKVSDVVGLRKMQETQRPLIIPDVHQDPDWVYSIPEHHWIRSYIGMPLITRNKVIGFLNILSRTPNYFSEGNSKPIESFAHHAAIAVENARLYQQLQQQNKHLEAQVATRMVELTEANQALQISNKELTTYAHMVAHDLQNPLSNILGLIELIRTRSGSISELNSIEDDLEHIEQSGWQMSRIITNLLLLGSIRQQTITPTSLAMNEIIDNVLLTLIRQVSQSKATIEQPSSWPTVLGFAPWVEAVWRNYISNAIKYGGQPPHIKLGAHELADGMVRFWVRDNGAGISPEDQKNLFTEFHRLGGEHTQGHGIGLSIVWHICEKLGGTAGVDSTVGQGSTFYFTLPKE